MYMTRMELDRSRRETVLALAAPNRLHGAIESGFPGERRRRLWRVDELNGRCYVLIVSEEMPNLTSAAAQFAPEGSSWETRDYEPFLNRIVSGSQWRFRLSANPTTSSSRGSEERGKVLAHVKVEQQEKWLLERAQKHGFLLEKDGFSVKKRGVLAFKKGPERRQVTLGYCEYEGVLKVTDADLFRTVLTEGIGRGKAYGLGLLTIARG